ncbi:triose-phosphate isomerase [Erwiniaceae bacterium BAC15a-03b]|uniref:Triosephosphate isomerase n=1 Tax=Winslowiella arboricola TaxID=2978220 RepID=A0A9J6PIN7_9GAMM|nr:triose-phosphate isomerase family protein [Winslowiella arboricola]MCU5771119.1 triose-phosphate isomerase [Winslowiella arboricola]MCU5777226.1 triose-phosphate isomerase [Winslowiella arboricola]
MTQPRITLGVSLKMYFSYQQTLAWSEEVAEIARHHPAIVNGEVGLFVLPAFPAIAAIGQIFSATAVSIGAQDLCWEDSGAWTGEVGGPMLAELGCRYVEIGHAERRRHFAETDVQIAAKLAAALRNGLTPVLCFGEEQQLPPDQAIATCRQQLIAALSEANRQQLRGEVVLAWEPQWAIGAPAPAPDAFIAEVCDGLRQLNDFGDFHFRVIYGGSAGPGLLSRLGHQVNGLFLGRFAHQPAALRQIIDEAAALAATSPSATEA